MAVTSVSDFLQLLEKSSLLTTEQLAEVRTWPEQEPKTISARMVQTIWVTKWQAQQLLSGKSNFQLGKYRLLELIGQGGMGSVYKAAQPAIGRVVALKVMSKQLMKQPKSVTRFLREIRTAAAVDHVNVVRAYDADCVGDTYFLVMEFVSGRNLKSWIRNEHSLPIGWSCECIRQTALGLQHAFEQGMVHRDIKPSNLLVTQNEGDGLPLVKILDLGLARFASETHEDGELTRSGQVLGTPDYIAPEQARNTKTADIRADIFSLGCSLFELLTGRLPFPGDSVMEKLMARATHDAPRVRLYRPDVPGELDDVLARMLARDPQHRYQTPADVAYALSPFAIGTSENSRRPASARAATPNAAAGVSTGIPSAVTFASLDDPADGTFNGFPDDQTHISGNDADRPKDEPRVWWQHVRVRIGVGIAGVLLVAGLVWSQMPRQNKTSTESVVGHTHSSKKHKKSDSDAKHEPGADSHADHGSEWETARWVLEMRGSLTLIAGSRHTSAAPKGSAGKTAALTSPRLEIHDVGELPPGRLKITDVGLHGNVRMNKGDFERLAKLSHLESLSLADTRFADADMVALETLTSLTRLDLHDTPVGDAGVAPLKNLPKLESLELSRTHVTGKALDTLRSVKTLTELSLEGTQVTDSDLRHLMPQLLALNLAATRVKGPGLQFVKRLKGLIRLDLGGLPMQSNGISHLKGMSSVQYLRLSASRVSDADLALLSGMTSLRELQLRSTSVSGGGLKNLTWMAELERLDLQNTIVADDGLKALRKVTSLKSLNLQGTLVSDAGIDDLAGLTRLEFVDLTGTKVSLKGIEALRNALPKCEIVY